jgi:DNA-binding transcriptional MerR regulator
MIEIIKGGGKMEKDEISMSWNKKVSLKEIAQFYENKLRELDAKQNMLEQEIEKALQKIGQKTQELENSIENIKKFVDKLNETQKSIENLRNEINKKDKILNEKIKLFYQDVGIMVRKIDILDNALKDFIGYQVIKNEVSDLLIDLILTLITPKDIKQIKIFMKDLENAQCTIGKESINGKLMNSLEGYLKSYFDNFINISAVIQPDRQYYEFLATYIIKYYQQFLLRHEKVLREFLNWIGNNKDGDISIFDNYNLFNNYFYNIDIDKNKTKYAKEGLK